MSTCNRSRNEGNRYLKNNHPVKALKYFNEALSQKPDDVECLINRSMCYVSKGENNKALRDIDLVLTIQPNNLRALLQKGNIHYDKGEFEMSLLYYSKAKSLKIDSDDIARQTNKAQYAIKSCVGHKATEFLKNAHVTPDLLTRKMSTMSNEPVTSAGSGRPHEHLLDEINKDRLYLIQFHDEEERRIANFRDTKPSYVVRPKKKKCKKCRYLGKITYDSGFMSFKILKEIEKSLRYLNPRSDFWQQRQPFYTRKENYKIVTRPQSVDPALRKWSLRYLILEFVHMEMLTYQYEYQMAIVKAEQLLNHLSDCISETHHTYHIIVSDIYSIIGNCYLKLNMLQESLNYHEKDLANSIKYEIKEAKSRSLDYIGHIYLLDEKHDKAIDVWRSKVNKVKSSIEETWLCHELARCYMAKDQYNNALYFADIATKRATQSMNEKWKLNSFILKAKCSEYLQDYVDALELYMRALDISKILNLTKVSNEIEKLVEEIILKRNERLSSRKLSSQIGSIISEQQKVSINLKIKDEISQPIKSNKLIKISSTKKLSVHLNPYE